MLFPKITPTICLAIFLVCFGNGQGLDYVMINILKVSPDDSEDNCSQGEPELFSFDHDFPTAVRDDSDSSLPTLPYDGGSGANVTDKPLVDGLTTGPNAHQQIGGLPPTLEPTPPQTSSWTHNNESATSVSTEVPSNTRNCFSHFFDFCSGVIDFTWLSIPPFIFDHQNTSHQLMNENTDLKGVFYNIIRRAIQFCCRYHDKRGTRLQFNHKAWNKSMLHKNIFRGDADIGLPVYIENDFFDSIPGSYAGSLRFIKVLESPGLALIMDKNNVKESSKQVVWRAIANEWPIMLISLLLCAISGICVWALDTTWNADEFPRPFHRGAFDGFWWAFVTMSTVGYGDKAPKSIIARLFCIVWIMTGLTVCSVMTATLTTALASTVGRDVQLVGKKIAVLKGGPAFQEVIKQGGNPTAFDNFDDMHKALVQTKTVSGILDEMYSGLHHMEQMSDSRLYVAKVIQRVRSYGFAFKENEPFAWPVEECIRNLILYRSEDVYTLMKEYMDGIEEKLSDAMGDDDVIVLGGNSPAFRSIVISLTIFLGALIGAVLLYEMVVFFYRRVIIKNRTEDIESAGVSNANYGASVRSVSEQEMGL